MALKKTVRDLIIGEDKFIESHGEFKRAMLSGQFALIGMLLVTFYLLFDFSMGVYETLPIYATAIFFLAITLFIHRQGDHELANYILLPTVNITIYLFASSEGSQLGYKYILCNNRHRGLCRVQLQETAALNSVFRIYIFSVCTGILCRLHASCPAANIQMI